MDWVTKTLKDYEIPFEIVLFSVLVISVFLLCIPNHWAVTLRLEDFLKDYEKYLGIAAIASGVLLAALLIRKVFLRWRKSMQLAKEEKAHSEETSQEKQFMEETLHSSISTLDNCEKAILREFFIQKRNAIQVPEEDIAVASLLQEGIIHTIGDGKQVLGIGWVYPVSLSLSAAAIIKGSGPQVIGFPPGIPTSEQVKRIQSSRPGFVLDIERSNW
jgi:hypothetical protein